MRHPVAEKTLIDDAARGRSSFDALTGKVCATSLGFLFVADDLAGPGALEGLWAGRDGLLRSSYLMALAGCAPVVRRAKFSAERSR